MFGGSPPPPPDYSGAAREQAQAGRQLTAEQTYANRPDIYTPFGTIRWTPPEYDPWYGTGGQPIGGAAVQPGGYVQPRPAGYDPAREGPGYAESVAAAGQSGAYSPPNVGPGAEEGGLDYGQAPGRWGMSVELSPEAQAALEAQQRIGAQRSGLAEEMFGRVQGELGEAPDFSGLPEGAQGLSAMEELPDVGTARERAEETLYGRQTRRLDPEWARRQEQMSVQLMNQGILPGSAAHTRAMEEFERSRGEAYAGAREQAILGGGAEAQRELGMGIQRGRYGREGELEAGRYAQARREAAIMEQLQRRGWSLNEINALLSGQQIGMPQFPGFSQAGVSQAPNLLGAAGQQYGAAMQGYGAQQAQLQGLMSGLFGLGGAALPFMF